ncbi:MAG: hypothetical protein HY286_05075 [Planctomycetes bacterium]|nr:hypothetical protein [Planctomycetota bacterium]
MRNITIAILTVAGALAPAASAQAKLGAPPPEFDAVKWYNSPPLTLSELKGKAVYLDIFRTW